ncbi:MAG TPA: NAD-dependent epimerase/dehydratase family protein [Candidatus Saccharimonadales bacterium]|nr:NAD-dependent epimerase/dehydratase family protein [Candidatus Saccharimonadales bacterium]
MRALVTGGAGFIGSHITDALIDAGHTVTVIDDLSRGTRAQVNPRASFVELDITSPELAAAVVEAHPEVVFHAAAQIDVRESVRDPLHDADVNVVGTVNVLRAAVDAAARRVVFASSGGAIYGDTEVIPTPEEHPCLPASPYGTAKLCAEAYGGTFSRQAGLEFVALRYANVYGPRQDPHGEAGVVAIFATRLTHGEPVVINGDGTQTRDYVHVHDVVRANLAAVDGPAGVYNIGTGVETDVNTVYRMLAAAAGVNASAVHGPAKPGEQQRSCLDTAGTLQRLGWRAAISFDDGARSTVEYFTAR